MSGPTGWVTTELGIQLDVRAQAGGPAAGARIAGSIELGLRRNPLRAQLLVSRLLGKHVPARVTDVLGAGRLLGDLVRGACAGPTPVVVGFAETATALGHAVASVAGTDGTQAPYLHTTRRPAPEGARLLEFREEHSHATQQGLALLPGGAVGDALGRADVPLVLVDDEISTGRTAINAIRALHAVRPRDRYVVASLLDSRTAEQHRELEAFATGLGTSVTSVALLRGTVRTPADVLDRAARLLDRLAPPPGPSGRPVPVVRRALVLPPGLPTLAAHGWDGGSERLLTEAVDGVAPALPVHRDARTLVLGDEEFMYLPQRLAAALGPEVRTSTTTRSPAAVVDAPGYPLRTVLRFPATEDPDRAAFAYNVAPSAQPDPGNAPGFDDIVLVSDALVAGHTDVLVDLLAATARRSVHVVQVCATDGAR
ncbi:phosphoribosyltransferase family protein [Blastococcus atacamensis]|uniref:phosphoribosyltransferase family protein n=1 Tax=Blastococcus atacamensis TaxID=2070508 RepID=UPI0012FFE289|nr:phosphoribosyltransferase family protein [Blastococcus atacamensis]